MPEIKTTSVDYFIKKSVSDSYGRPCVLHARVKSELRHLTDNAVSFVKDKVSQPYDNQYSGEKKGKDKKGWYCSELILEAFRHANDGRFVFPQTPMGFRDLETGDLFPYWIELYKKAGKPIPEGEPGSHPALLSCSEKLDILEIVGQMPARIESVFSNRMEYVV